MTPCSVDFCSDADFAMDTNTVVIAIMYIKYNGIYRHKKH
jgi:hypothetical protein